MTDKPSMSLAQISAEYDVSIKTLRRRIADGSLPAYRLGPRLIRVYTDDVLRLFRPIPTARRSA